jgi:hypothetical protein
MSRRFTIEWPATTSRIAKNLALSKNGSRSRGFGAGWTGTRSVGDDDAGGGRAA